MNDIKLEWFGHSSFKMQISGKTLFFDPIRKNKLLETTLNPSSEKDVTSIIVSHEHWDHYDPDTIISLSSSETKIYCPVTVATPLSCRLTFEAENMRSLQKLTQPISPLQTNDEIHIDGISIKCLKATEGLSFLINYEKKNVLFMGDSVATKEMIGERPDLILFPIWAVKGKEADIESFLQLSSDSIYIPMHFHKNPDSLPNFYIESIELQELLPRNINLNILEKNVTFEF